MHNSLSIGFRTIGPNETKSGLGFVEANESFSTSVLTFVQCFKMSIEYSMILPAALSGSLKFLIFALVSLRVANADPLTLSHMYCGWWASFSAQCCCRGWVSFSVDVGCKQVFSVLVDAAVLACTFPRPSVVKCDQWYSE